MNIRVVINMHNWILAAAFVALLSACESEQQTPLESAESSRKTDTTVAVKPMPVSLSHPKADASTLARGEKLFHQHCAQCHGKNAVGAPNWHQPDAQGRYPAPPLNGTAHAWHHPMKALRATIKGGTQRLGGSMPPWDDKLSDEEIDAIIYWFQALWPEQIYQAWERMDKQS